MSSTTLTKVYEFAENAHRGQKRKSGIEDYITHPLNVASMAENYGADLPTIYACLLHDVVEDTPHTLKEIEKKFGKEVAYLVDGVTKEGTLTEKVNKIKKYSEKDKRVILIKMFDTIYKLQTAFDPKNEKRLFINLEKKNFSTKAYIELGKKHGYSAIAKNLEDELTNLHKRLSN